VSIDERALADRFYADAVANALYSPERFYEAKTTSTWKEIDRNLRKQASVYLKDIPANAAEAERALENVKAKFGNKADWHRPVRDISFLRNIAATLLQQNGREMCLKVDREEPGREILRWRFLSLLLPASILLSAATRDEFPAPKAVRILDASMAPNFPVAQNHLHHAAITSFEELWASLRFRSLTQLGSFLNGVQDKRAFCPKLHSGVCPGGKTEHEKRWGKKNAFARARHMGQWAVLIRQAFIARRVLKSHSWHSDPFVTCTRGICMTARHVLVPFLTGRIAPLTIGRIAYPWPDELMTLARCYRQFNAPVSSRLKSKRRASPIQADAMEERRLVTRVFSKLNPEGEQLRDDKFEILFLQYLRIKTAVFRLLVHPPGEHGLEQFLEYFSQIKIYAGETDSLTPPIPDEPGLNVQATEYRVAPDAWLKKLRYRSTVEEETNGPKGESAWLIHFKRKEEDKRLPLFLSAVREMEREATMIAAALDQKPERLRKLRGIDLCGVEGTQPLWVSAPTLGRLRLSSQKAAARRPGLRLDPLRLTLHVGEDFQWLTSGVRAIAEPFQWKLIERGDRVGHGIAITLEPQVWWNQRAGQVLEIKRLDRFLDLAFLTTYTKDIEEYRRTPEQTEWLKNELMKEAEEIWPKLAAQHSDDLIGIAVEIWNHLGSRTTRRLMDDFHWAGMAARNANGSKIHSQADDYRKWIHSYLWNRSVQEKAQETIRLKVDNDNNDARTNSKRNELELLVEARKRLIREMARWQVCIESCPSSNLIVGSLDAMSAQDFLQQRPTKEKQRGEETLTWTISTDDPITFSTTLADEYAYAWAGMVLREKKPYDPSYARALLDEAAKHPCV
jgi:hypothetical protein